MRFSKCIVPILLLLSGHAYAAPAPEGIDPQFAEQLRQQQKMVEQARQNAPDLDVTVPDSVKREAEKFGNRAARASMSAILQASEGKGVDQITPNPDDPALDSQQPADDGDHPRYAVLVSSAMPEAELRAAMRELARPDVAFYFRGFHPEETGLTGTMQRIAAYVDDHDLRPEVFIDPTPFRRFNVQSVPAVFIRDKHDNVVLAARGNMNVDYLEEKLEGHKGPYLRDLGTIGPTFPIAEKDLLIDIQQRLAAVDWEEKRRQAAANFWKKYDFPELPPARETETRRFDPSVLVTKDFHLEQPGEEPELIAAKGERHNPLDHTSFNRRVFVFDATDPKQLAIVEREAKARQDFRRSVFITTRMDRDNGWDRLGELSHRFKSPLFMLTPELQAMFRLRALPSIVTADGRLLVVEEVEVPL